MYFDAQGNLLACADEKTELWSITPDGRHTVLAKEFESKPLNGPNDVWVRPDGGLYLTDPFYRREWWDYNKRPQDGEHVYFLAADRKTLKRVTSDDQDVRMPPDDTGPPHPVRTVARHPASRLGPEPDRVSVRCKPGRKDEGKCSGSS